MHAPDDPTPPLFSIITVCLNAAEYIAEALESVASQECGDYEYLVVDGGSTDGTLRIVASFEPRFGGRLRVWSEPDEGLYDAMNRGLARARGRYVMYCGADDRLAPASLEAVAAAIDEAGAPTIVCGATRVFDDEGSWLEVPRSFARGSLPKRAPARHQSLFVEREALVAAGGFDVRWRIAADYDLYLKLHEAGATERSVDTVLSEFRLGGVSSTDAAATAREYRDIRIAHGGHVVKQQLTFIKEVAASSVFALSRRLRRGGAAE